MADEDIISVIQSGTDLQLVNALGGLSSALDLPTDVTLADDRPPRWTTADSYAVLVNTPTYPLIIDDLGNVMPLSIDAPGTPPTLAGTVAGTLSGTFRVKYTFVVQTLDGVVVAESDFSPAAPAITISSKLLNVSALETYSSPFTIDSTRYQIIRRLYRTSTGTETYFEWLDVEDNVTTSTSDDTADADLAAFAAPALGQAPALTLIAAHKDRLWGVASDAPDVLRYTETAAPWSWPTANRFVLPKAPQADSQQGATALIPRRDTLGIGKADLIAQLSGSDTTTFRMVTLSTDVGILGQESVALFRGAAYFLWRDGVYRWSDSGITCPSDGQVRSWFVTGPNVDGSHTPGIFDRTRFDEAFGIIDPTRLRYRLFVSGADGTIYWVELDLIENVWWGPHKTAAYTPRSAFILLGDGSTALPLVGVTETAIVEESEIHTDGTSTAIVVDGLLAPEFMTEPDTVKYMGELTLILEPQAAGVLTVTPTVGEIGDDPQLSREADLRKRRNVLPRLGVGRMFQLRFQHSTAGEHVGIAGFEFPTHKIGAR